MRDRTEHLRHTEEDTYYRASVFVVTEPRKRLPVGPLSQAVRQWSSNYYGSLAGRPAEFSHVQLGGRADVAASTVGKVIRQDHATVHIDIADKLCSAMGTSIEEVYGRAEAPDWTNLAPRLARAVESLG